MTKVKVASPVKSLFCIVAAIAAACMITITSGAVFVGCSQPRRPVCVAAVNGQVFGSLTVSGKIYAEGRDETVIQKAAGEIKQMMLDLDAAITTNPLSNLKTQSYIYKLNNNLGAVNVDGVDRFEIDMHAYTMLSRAKELNVVTEGYFDPTVYPLVKLWGLDNENLYEEHDSIPTKNQIDSTLQNVGVDKFTLLQSDGKYYLTKTDASGKAYPALQVDLGGQAKGYAADRAFEIIRSYPQIISAVVNISGNLAVYGLMPFVEDYNADTGIGYIKNFQPYNIAVTNPFNPFLGNKKDFCVFRTGFAENGNDGISAVTSGDYERYYIFEGTAYCHIIDPHTGYPVNVDPATLKNINDNKLTSATFILESSELADVYATTAVAMGMRDAVRWTEQNNLSGVFIGLDSTFANTVPYPVIRTQDGAYNGAWQDKEYGFTAFEGHGFTVVDIVNTPLNLWLIIGCMLGVFLVGVLAVTVVPKLIKRKKKTV